MLSAPALVAAVLTFGTFLPGVAHGAAPKAPSHPQVFTPNSMGGLTATDSVRSRGRSRTA